MSSQDEGATGRVFQEPWTYEGTTDRAMRKLRDLIESMPGVRGAGQASGGSYMSMYQGGPVGASTIHMP